MKQDVTILQKLTASMLVVALLLWCVVAIVTAVKIIWNV
jgi:hypothetical protein